MLHRILLTLYFCIVRVCNITSNCNGERRVILAYNKCLVMGLLHKCTFDAVYEDDDCGKIHKFFLLLFPYDFRVNHKKDINIS